MVKTVRVWDLPTRLFHWALVISVVSLVITGNVGGNAMPWHFRSGYCVLTLLLFRLVWGVVGGHWSRFVNFVYSPVSVLNYLRGRPKPEHLVGHNPMGAFSVFGLLAFLLLQVSTGLFSDDEIAAAGPLARFLNGDLVSKITGYHAEVGKVIVIVLVLLHVGAIVYYRVKKKENLVTPMLTGDKHVDVSVPASIDTLATQAAALLVLVVCGAGVAYLVSFGT
jgi:cytochrome b